MGNFALKRKKERGSGAICEAGKGKTVVLSPLLSLPSLATARQFHSEVRGKRFTLQEKVTEFFPEEEHF